MADSRPGSPAAAPRAPSGRRQVEKVLSVSVAAFGVIIAAQTVPLLVAQLPEGRPLWLAVMVPALYGTLLLALVLSIAQRWVAGSHGLFALVYLACVISWPFGVLPGAQISPALPWLAYLTAAATAAATIAFPTVWACVYLLLVPAIYTVVRVTAQGGAVPLSLALLEGVYSLILGAVVILVVTIVRQAASSVDAAQAAALQRYSHAVRQHATEIERLRVDSMVHDSVLAALISAARADTPQSQALAATMAGNAIRYLQDAAAPGLDEDTAVPVSVLAERIVDAAALFSSPIEVRRGDLGCDAVPAYAAEALYSATVQAMVNSVQHAGAAALHPRLGETHGLRRSVAIAAGPSGGVEVVVADSGTGFTVAEGPSTRLGVRLSIIERLSTAGGQALIESAPGRGTVVTLRWPHPDS